MPFKHNAPRRHHIPKARRRITNGHPTKLACGAAVTSPFGWMRQRYRAGGPRAEPAGVANRSTRTWPSRWC